MMQQTGMLGEGTKKLTPYQKTPADRTPQMASTST